VRNIIASDEFRLIYPGVELAEDSRAAGKWQTKLSVASLALRRGHQNMPPPNYLSPILLMEQKDNLGDRWTRSRVSIRIQTSYRREFNVDSSISR
jgi:hypothetical protein